MKIRFVWFQEYEVGRLYVRSNARLHNHRSCDYGLTIAFFFGVGFNKQVIVKKLFAIR